MIIEITKNYPEWVRLIIPIAIIILCFTLGLLIRKYLFNFLKKYTAKTETKIDDIIFNALRRPFLLWFAILGIELASKTLFLHPKIENFIDSTLLIIWIISFMLVISRLTLDTLQLYYQKRNSPFHTTSIFQNIIKLLFIIIGIMLILNSLGISITPIITALGIGGLAVALALQDTLNNLFSGFYITLSQQIRVGDYIQLENGSEGWVKDIGWRNTTLLLLTNNYVIIPNGKLAQNIITNYSLPDSRSHIRINYNVSYDSDINKVEKLLLETINEVLPSIPGTMTEPPPVVLFNPGPGDYALIFTVSIPISKYADRNIIISEINKAIFQKFKKENINIPYPIRTIYMKRELEQ